ncbi:MAG: hypothetical protein ACLFPU_06460 [Dehalococcoidia bacterium]
MEKPKRQLEVEGIFWDLELFRQGTDLAAEVAVLGSLFMSAAKGEDEAVAEGLRKVHPSLFARKWHRQLLKAVKVLADRGEALTVASVGREASVVAGYDLMPYLRELFRDYQILCEVEFNCSVDGGGIAAAITTEVGALDSYLPRLKEAFKVREIKAVCSRIMENAENGQASETEVRRLAGLTATEIGGGHAVKAKHSKAVSVNVA